MFFWVFPRRQIVVGRRFGTLYQFHLQRLDVECEVWGKARKFIPVLGFRTGASWTNGGCLASGSGQFRRNVGKAIPDSQKVTLEQDTVQHTKCITDITR